MNLKESLKIFYRWVFRGEKTYSQLGEDLIVNFFLPSVKKGTYADIGANNPTYLNNTYFFYKKGWTGLCVEPSSLLCGLIKKVRPKDTVLNVGLAAKDGEMELYILDPDTLSTFSKTEAERCQKLGHRLVETKKVPVRTLASVLKDFNKQPDLLSIDTEGMDLEILAGNDWEKFRPKIVIAEIIEYHGKQGVRINKPMDAFFAGKGYLKLADTHINGIYIEQSYAAAEKLEGII